MKLKIQKIFFWWPLFGEIFEKKQCDGLHICYTMTVTIFKEKEKDFFLLFMEIIWRDFDEILNPYLY